MPPHQVSPATKAAVNREEMDAALARLQARPHPNTIRIQRIDRASTAFLCMFWHRQCFVILVSHTNSETTSATTFFMFEETLLIDWF